MANYKHGFRKYSERAKAAGEVMRNYLLLAKSDLTVQEARDACTYCRALLERDVRESGYSLPDGFADVDASTFPSPTEYLEGDDDGIQ